MKIVILAALINIFAFSQMAEASETLNFATLEWPPYLSEKLKDQGFGILILKEAFKAEGYKDIKVDFLPWSRALMNAEKGKTHIGVLMAYYSKERTEKFIYSDPIASGPIQFVMRKNNVIKWKNLVDLKNKSIGVVQDYINSPELDDLISKKVLKSDPSISDLNNLQKLAHSRTDLAVIDSNVFNYLLKTAPELTTYKDQLVVDTKILEDKKLYVLFTKNKNGMRLAKIFNEGLKKINSEKIAKKYMNEL